MYYCENCHLLCEWPVCGYCGTRPLREPRADDYCFLSSRNEPWAQMLAELLQEERIAVVTRPVPQRGFGYSGERSAYTELFVPFPELERAKELERALLTSEPSFPEGCGRAGRNRRITKQALCCQSACIYSACIRSAASSCGVSQSRSSSGASSTGR